MILIINICKEKLHHYEFVKPVERIVENNFNTKHYKDITKKEIDNADKIIICGTALMDNKYLKDVEKFSWIKNYERPILGICAGMQIIGLLFGGKLKKKTEIGFYEEDFKDILGVKGKQKVYHLHNNFVEFSKEFKYFTRSKIPQAVKNKDKEIYGVLFHPEVRNKEIIERFIRL